VTPLRPTVKRDLSLYSVLSWRSGYPYPAVFHYDGRIVNFYPPADAFARFKEVTMPEIAGDDERFQKLNREFQENVRALRRQLDDLSSANLTELSTLIGRIMSFYVLVVSDSFVAKRPEAWESRLMSEGILYEADEKIEKLIATKLGEVGADPKLAHVLTVEEIGNLFECGSLPSTEVHNRLADYVLDAGELLTDITFAEHCERHGYLNPEAAVTAPKELTGQGAGPGCAVGRVRIIRARNDLSNFKPGEVIVAVMTNATYAPYIRKAAAVVTDEGGRTCHAAIAAREMKTPCIVGTLSATTVLKDGDLVEVDADHGVVKVLPPK
jgi:phosphohistidine swiveling domain-containing protein